MTRFGRPLTAFVIILFYVLGKIIKTLKSTALFSIAVGMSKKIYNIKQI